MQTICEQLDQVGCELPCGKLYLDLVEAAAMDQLIECINDKDFDGADHCIEIMERLSIV